jgi:bifunctional N-acetylglucosamine-1-phosphate-uridyltransferase/glucosamine-1-phosphate-acetyltransferase GlmU-like protein
LEQLGTAHAVLQCRDILQDFSGNVLILYGDVPLIKVETLANLLSIHSETDTQSTILTTNLPDPTGYGRIIRNKDDSLKKIVEEKDATDEERQVVEINSGIYVFDAQTLFRLLPLVENNNKQNEYYLPDVLNLIIHEKGKVAIDKIKNYVEIQGVNNLEQLEEVNEFYENN